MSLSSLLFCLQTKDAPTRPPHTSWVLPPLSPRLPPPPTHTHLLLLNRTLFTHNNSRRKKNSTLSPDECLLLHTHTPTAAAQKTHSPFSHNPLPPVLPSPTACGRLKDTLFYNGVFQFLSIFSATVFPCGDKTMGVQMGCNGFSRGGSLSPLSLSLSLSLSPLLTSPHLTSPHLTSPLTHTNTLLTNQKNRILTQRNLIPIQEESPPPKKQQNKKKPGVSSLLPSTARQNNNSGKVFRLSLSFSLSLSLSPSLGFFPTSPHTAALQPSLSLRWDVSCVSGCWRGKWEGEHLLVAETACGTKEQRDKGRVAPRCVACTANTDSSSASHKNSVPLSPSVQYFLCAPCICLLGRPMRGTEAR